MLTDELVAGGEWLDRWQPKERKFSVSLFNILYVPSPPMSFYANFNFITWLRVPSRRSGGKGG